MSNNIRPLFSISAFVALALVGTGGAFFLNTNHKVEKPIQEQPNVVKQVEAAPIPVVAPPPTPTTTYEVPKIEAPVRHVAKKPISVPNVKAAITADKPCELVCGEWENGVLFADGTRYKRCECK